MSPVHPLKPVRISLVIPAWNEAAALRSTCLEADAALSRVADDHEIIVVDDGSTDGTPRVAAEIACECRSVRVLRHPTNQGYGAALRTGFCSARHELVAFTDADGQFDLSDLRLLIPLAQIFDVVCGFRLDRKDSARRRFLSWGYNRLASTLLGTLVRDIDCALKLFRRDALLRILPESTGFFVNTEMLARARLHGLRVTEVGVTHRPRRAGQSKVCLRDVPRTLSKLLPFCVKLHLGRLETASSLPRPVEAAFELTSTRLRTAP
jgi:dolichol-phosphate mannosyltransferase